MSNTSLNLIEFNTSLSQQSTPEDTTLPTFHHEPPPTPIPQKQQKTPELSEEIDQDGITLTAAGLTRAMETNQGQSLTEIINISTSNPSHLFWVPASQHPELAPTEFEKYVVALRANAKDKGKIRRRRSVLSQSFTAADNEGDTSNFMFEGQQNDSDDDELPNNNSKEGERQSALGALENKHHQHVISLGRSNSLQIMGEMDDNNHHLLLESTINHDHTGKNDQANNHTTKARKERLRRSMSLHLPSNTDTGRIPDFLVFDRNSTALDQSPVLVPKTDRPLSRRGARTRFQRTSSIAPSTTKLNNFPPERQSAYRHSDSIYTSSSSSTSSPPIITDNYNNNNNSSIHGNNAITEKYNNSNNLEISIPVKDDQPNQFLQLSDTPIIFEEPQTNLDLITSAITKPSQEPTINQQQGTTNNSSPIESTNLNHDISTIPHQSTYSSSIASSITHPNPIDFLNTQQQQQTAVKSLPRERKSSWSWSFWSDDKKSKLEQPSPTTASISSSTNNETRQIKHDDGYNKTENTPPPPMVTSTSTPTSKQRFGFSSLFSRKSSSTTTTTSNASSGPNGGKSGNEENSTMLMVPPKDFQLNKFNHQHRLPIHVERAVYRLSHMKLANPRRPLHDQVIISNFMFWYLTIISEQQQNQAQNQSTSSSPLPAQQQQEQQHTSMNGNASSRHSPPRTPQQIVTASKNKKKRLTKKSNQQNHAPPPLPTLSSSASSSSSLSSVSSHQSKHSSSISQKASSYEQHQHHHPLSSSPSSHQQHTQNKSWQHYIDGSSKQASTGFVIPENYLRPTSESNLSDSTNNKTDVDKQPQRQHRQYVRRNSSSSEDDDDDEDDDDEDDDDDDDDGYDNNYKDKNKKSFYTGSKSKHQQKEKTAKQMSKHMKKQQYPSSHHHQRMTPPIPQPTSFSS